MDIETPEEFEIIPAHHLAGLLFSKTKRTYPSGAQEILPAYSLDTATELIESCFTAIRTDERRKAAERQGELLEAARAFQALNVCYRVGKTPSEALFRRIEKATAAIMAEHQGGR